MKKIEHIVFDLGGVLVDWDGVTPLVRLSGERLSREDARRFWFRSPWIARFEKNQCSTREFADGIIDELALELTAEEFIREFRSWNRGLFGGCDRMLERLRQSYTLSCLTNNNPLYIDDLIASCDLAKKFDHLFISYQTGLLKPAPEAFAHIVDMLNCPAETILFFDDNSECVDSARGQGLVAYQVKGCEQVAEVLAELGLLS